MTLDFLAPLAANSPQPDLPTHAFLRERLGECAMIIGKFEDARKAYEKALEIRRRLTFATAQEEKHAAQIEALIWGEIGQTWRYPQRPH